MTIAYAVVVEREEDGRYSVYVPDLPGCASMGDTFAEADHALAALVKSRPAESGTLAAKGYERFLAGDFSAAVAEYEAAIARGGAPAGTKEMLRLARASAEATQGHVERRSAHFVFRFAPEDQVLADYGIETLEAAAAALGADLGFELPRPIRGGGAGCRGGVVPEVCRQTRGRHRAGPARLAAGRGLELSRGVGPGLARPLPYPNPVRGRR